MHPVRIARRGRARTVAVLVVALGALAGLGGCVSIASRVWQNGRNVPSVDVLYGPRDLRSHDRLYKSADPLLAWHQTLLYQPFGTWW